MEPALSSCGDATVANDWERQFAQYLVIAKPPLAVVRVPDATTYLFHGCEADYLADKIKSYPPGLKVLTTRNQKGERSIQFLGKILPGSLPGLHKQVTSLPPCINVLYFGCAHVGRGNRQQSEGRKTHILPDCECPMRVVLRTLHDERSNASFAAVTLAKGSHGHSCPDVEAHRARLTPDESARMISWLMSLGSAQAV